MEVKKLGKGKISWEEAVNFHGHSCMGLASGYRVAEAAWQIFRERDVDEEIVAIVENDNCSVDAIQAMLGCTLGKGNLIFRDYGKPAYTFIRRKDEKAIRIVLLDRPGPKQNSLNDLRAKVFAGTATEAERELYRAKNEELIADYLARPQEELLEIKDVDTKIPEKARIFSSVICSTCGEKVMEPRARLQGGRVVCIPCSEEYTRGW